MEKRMPPKWQSAPKRWRVRGTAADGLVVTLGRYETEEQAITDRDRLVREGVHRNVHIDPIPPAPEAAPPGGPVAGR